jgi:glycosyltransferase involved in cell wall biosynthesis
MLKENAWGCLGVSPRLASGTGNDSRCSCNSVLRPEPVMLTTDIQGLNMTFPADLAHSAETAAEAAITRADEWFSPVRLMDVELTESLPAVPYDGQHRRVWVLGRLHTEPVGVGIVQLDREGLTPDQLGALLWQEFRTPVTERFAGAGLPSPPPLTGEGLEADPATWPFLLRRATVLAAAPVISVVVPTRGRPERRQTWLDCLSRQEYPRFEIVVVDNAPTSDVVRTFVDTAQRRGMPVRYVREPRPGTSRADNAGVAASAGEIITFCADDGEPDRHWLAGLACGFARGDDIGCVTGMVLPARLETPAQDLYEQFGGYRKGRGFSPDIFSRHGPQSPLYPIPPFGTGACIAFRREALGRIGGFDVALGPGTPSRAGTDLLAMTMVLLAGYRIAYEPAALMRHDHRRDLDGLRQQMEGYGTGLTAYYAALLRHRPSVLPELIRLAPTGFGYLRKADFTRTTAPPELLEGLKRRKRRSMLMGPVAYARSALGQARLAAMEVHRS